MEWGEEAVFLSIMFSQVSEDGQRRGLGWIVSQLQEVPLCPGSQTD